MSKAGEGCFFSMHFRAAFPGVDLSFRTESGNMGTYKSYEHGIS